MALWKKIVAWVFGSALYLIAGLCFTIYLVPILAGVSPAIHMEVLTEHPFIVLYFTLFWPGFLVALSVLFIVATLVLYMVVPVLSWLF